jgi:hypothetical protein
VKTATSISNNKLDAIIRDNEKGICLIIYTAISENRNVVKKKSQKHLKNEKLD